MHVCNPQFKIIAMFERLKGGGSWGVIASRCYLSRTMIECTSFIIDVGLLLTIKITSLDRIIDILI